MYPPRVYNAKGRENEHGAASFTSMCDVPYAPRDVFYARASWSWRWSPPVGAPFKLPLKMFENEAGSLFLNSTDSILRLNLTLFRKYFYWVC